jgi:hypothetical protein
MNAPMSALGQKATCAPQKVMSALPLKGDMCGATTDVRYGPKAAIRVELNCSHSLACFDPQWPNFK